MPLWKWGRKDQEPAAPVDDGGRAYVERLEAELSTADEPAPFPDVEVDDPEEPERPVDPEVIVVQSVRDITRKFLQDHGIEGVLIDTGLLRHATLGNDVKAFLRGFRHLGVRSFCMMNTIGLTRDGVLRLKSNLTRNSLPPNVLTVPPGEEQRDVPKLPRLLQLEGEQCAILTTSETLQAAAREARMKVIKIVA